MMFGRLRHWAGAGAVFTGLAFGVSAATGYLPAVGPTPLRFRPTVHSGTNLIQMPLPPPDPPAPPPPPPAPATPPAAETEVKKTPPAAAAAASSDPAGPDSTPSGSEPRISPQMLLRFFNRSTNGTTSGTIAPVGFAPPAPAQPPASTATYSTDPK